ncbi:hypothetical protein Efla_005095 [Eimeria flavescens]
MRLLPFSSLQSACSPPAAAAARGPLLLFVLLLAFCSALCGARAGEQFAGRPLFEDLGPEGGPPPAPPQQQAGGEGPLDSLLVGGDPLESAAAAAWFSDPRGPRRAPQGGPPEDPPAPWGQQLNAVDLQQQGPAAEQLSAAGGEADGGALGGGRSFSASVETLDDLLGLHAEGEESLFETELRSELTELNSSQSVSAASPSPFSSPFSSSPSASSPSSSSLSSDPPSPHGASASGVWGPSLPASVLGATAAAGSEQRRLASEEPPEEGESSDPGGFARGKGNSGGFKAEGPQKPDAGVPAEGEMGKGGSSLGGPPRPAGSQGVPSVRGGGAPSVLYKAPHEYYLDSRQPPPVKGLRWTPDPRVLQPELLQDLVRKPEGPDLSREKAWWQNIYGFNRELVVASTVKKGFKYNLVFTDILGAGAMGVVFSAVDLTNKRRIAVKVCRLQKPTNKGLHYTQEFLRRRTQEEITIWKHVPQSIGKQQWSNLSQVVIPLDVVEPVERLEASDEAINFSFEWVVLDVFAGDLSSIDSIWNGSMLARVEVAKQVIYATMSLHAMGLVHSDIKPLNFLVNHDGRIYIGDSSLSTASPTNACMHEMQEMHACMRECTGTQRLLLLLLLLVCLLQPVNQDTACVNGTLYYLPPENMRCQMYQKRRILTSERKDSWAVGVVLYDLFCSSLPFEIKGMPRSDIAAVVGNATIADVDFTNCHPETPLLMLGLIRLLLTPAVTLRPTLRELYLTYPLFGVSNAAIAGGLKVQDVESAALLRDPGFLQHLLREGR